MILEVLGSLLFIADWTIGALLLLLYTLAITPVVHDFWNSQDESVRGMEIILFFKVISLALSYISHGDFECTQLSFAIAAYCASCRPFKEVEEVHYGPPLQSSTV